MTSHADPEQERRDRERRARAQLRSQRVVDAQARGGRRGSSASGVAAAGPPARSWLASLGQRTAAIGAGFIAEVLDVLAGIARATVLRLPGLQHLVRERSVTHAQATVPRPVLTDAERRAVAARRMLVRRRLRAVLVVLGLVAAVAAAIAVPRSELFRIRHLEIVGASSVGDLDVRRRIDSKLAGETVFTVDEAAIARAVEELPFVRSVRIERHLPGGLQLHVVEYRPLAVGYGSGRFWLVSHDGRILAKARREDWSGRVPTVTLRTRGLKPGLRLRDEPALDLLDALGGRTMLAFDMVEVEGRRLSGRLSGDVKVRFGRPVQLRQKVLVADKLLRDARRRNEQLSYIDVSVASRPAACLRTVVACGMARVGTGRADARTEVVATTPEEGGGGAPAAT